MAKLSAGLLLYRNNNGVVEVLIGHPGGPFWTKKDDGAWSIPKGEYAEGEDPWEAAQREFHEEIGIPAPDGRPISFDPVKQPSGKIITAFAVEGDIDITNSRSNEFEMEWPKGSGRLQSFPEIDRVAWFTVAEARKKLLSGHVRFLDLLMQSPGVSDLEEGPGPAVDELDR